jgi:hypothetical protein
MSCRCEFLKGEIGGSLEKHENTALLSRKHDSKRLSTADHIMIEPFNLYALRKA